MLTTKQRFPFCAIGCWTLTLVLLLSACGPSNTPPEFAPPSGAVTTTGTAVPVSKAAITADNASELSSVARWGEGEARVLAVTPDEQTVAVGTTIGVSLYDAQTLRPRLFLPTASRVERLAIGPDSATLASAQLDGSIILWKLADGSRLHVLDARGRSDNLFEVLLGPSPFQDLESLAFSPDGSLLASDISGDEFRLWDVASGRQLHAFNDEDNRRTSLAFSPDGSLLAVGGGWQGRDGTQGTLQVWDVARRSLRYSLEGHTNVVQGLSFSPDGAELTSADQDRAIRRWSMANGEQIDERSVDQQVALLPGGWYATFGYEEPASIFNTVDGRLAFQLDEPIDSRDLPLIAAAGTTLVALHEGDALSRWNLASRKLLGRGTLPDHGLGGAGLAVTPDGAMMLVGRGDGTVELRRTGDGIVVGELRGHQDEIMSVTLSLDGTLVAVGSEDGSVTLWRLSDRALLRRLEVRASWVEGVAFSPSGELLATVGIQRERAMVKLWRVVDGQLLWEQDGGADVGDVVVFAPDGGSVIAGFWDGSVRQWNVADGALLRELRRAPTLRESVKAIVLSPDGTRAAVVFNTAKIELWSTEDWTRVHAYEGIVGHPESAAFSPDGQLFATGSSIDNVVQLWRADRGGKPLATFKGHTWEVANLAFTPDQTRLISAARDGTVRLWSVVKPNE